VLRMMRFHDRQPETDACMVGAYAFGAALKRRDNSWATTSVLNRLAGVSRR